MSVTRFATNGIARLAYETAGPESAAAVVFLHTLLADRREWGTVRESIADDYRLILPDARGHGASAAFANQRFTVADMAADIQTILDAEGISRAHLVGHGQGGAAALALALRDPARVRSLTLIEPALPAVLDMETVPAVVAARDAVRAADQAAADAAYKDLGDLALSRYLDPRWGDGWREQLPRLRLAALRRHAGALAATLTALNDWATSAAEISTLSIPTLLVRHDGAPHTDQLIGERLAGQLPAARLATIPAASPWSPFAGETGAAFTTTLRAFLREHP